MLPPGWKAKVSLPEGAGKVHRRSGGVDAVDCGYALLIIQAASGPISVFGAG